MSLLCDFFISNPADAPSYAGEPEFPDSDRMQLKRITPLEAAGLLEALRGGGDSVEMIDEFTLLTPQDAEAWTMAVPDDFVSLLAAVTDSSLPTIAQRFSEITVEELGWSADDAAPMITDIRALARRCQDERKQMFLWNSL